jgi:hypothetical protein
MSDSKHPAPSAPKDIAILSGPTEDGQGARMVRIREDGEVSAGEIRPLREGESLQHSEVVRLRPLDASQRVCEVEVLHSPQRLKAEGHGAQQGDDRRPEREHREHDDARAQRARQTDVRSRPARVSNAKYRANWSAIFEPRSEFSDSEDSSAPRLPNGNNPDWSVN